MHSSSIDLSRHKDTYTRMMNTSLWAIDLIVGLVEEMGQQEIMHGPNKVIRLEGLVNFGNARLIENGRQGLERLEFTPTPEDGFTLPKSYGGTSGGGCFRTLLDSTPKVVAYFMAGVAFWETKVNGVADKIICHGPE